MMKKNINTHAHHPMNHLSAAAADFFFKVYPRTSLELH